MEHETEFNFDVLALAAKEQKGAFGICAARASADEIVVDVCSRPARILAANKKAKSFGLATSFLFNRRDVERVILETLGPQIEQKKFTHWLKRQKFASLADYSERRSRLKRFIRP